jgi:HSP20 family protein
MIQYWNPFEELEDLQRRVNRNVAVPTTTNHNNSQETTHGTWAPATDVVEDSDALYIYIDLPDVDDNSLDVSSEQNHIAIKATRHYAETDNQTVHHRGRPKGAFVRSFNIPNQFDVASVEATYKRGVLQLRIPRAESVKARKVTINHG